MFLLAGGLVLWGALGQVATLAVLVAEFIRSNVVARTIGVILEAFSALLALLLIVYGLLSLYETADELSAEAANAQGTQPETRFPNGMPLPAPYDTTLKPPMPNWAML